MSLIEVVYCVVKEWNVVKVKLTKEGAERVKRLQAEGKCLACELPLEGAGRVVCGVHVNCDQTQRYAIRKGVTTQADLIKCGERLPPGDRGGKPKTDYAARLLGRAKRQRKGA